MNRGSGLRVRSWSTSTDSTAIVIAGAGPSSAIASTIAMNEPEIRCTLCCSARKSLPIASTRSTANSSSGSQDAAVELTAPTIHAIARTTTSPAISRVDRADIPEFSSERTDWGARRRIAMESARGAAVRGGTPVTRQISRRRAG